MGKGSSQTSTSSNQPPAAYTAAYQNVLNRATNAADTPYQPYTGSLQAPLNDTQNQGIAIAQGSFGVANPYINAAEGSFTNATAPLTAQQPYVDAANNFYQAAGAANLPGAVAPYLGQANNSYQAAGAANLPGAISPYVNQANSYFQDSAGANLQGALSPWQSAAQQGFANGSRTLTPDQYSGAAIQGFESPYTQQVVNATQAQFNNQNSQAQNQLRGNAASQGALGGDRFGVAQGVLAGQQQLAQAPVIAGLENQGFQQAQQEFNNQQQTKLTAQQQTQALQQQAAQGFAGLGQQSLTAAQQKAALEAQAGQGFTALGQENLTAAQQQAAIEAQVGQGFAQLGQENLTAAQQQAAIEAQAGQGIAGLGQTELGAQQAQGWLNAQAGQGYAGLGNEELSSFLQPAQAILQAGGLQQQQAQTGLNIPYEQYLAQQSYPFQTTGWLANIAEGLGGASGGTSSTSQPGQSVGSQIGGTLLGTTGLLGITGAFGNNGYLTGANGLFGAGSGALSDSGAGLSSLADAAWKRGGAIRGGFANGGGVPDVSTAFGSGAPGSQNIIAGAAGGVPSITSIVPGAQGLGSKPQSPGATPYIKQNFGSTTSQSGGGFNAGSLVGPALLAASIFNKGGSVPVAPRGFAIGGTLESTGGVHIPERGISAGASAPSMGGFLHTAGPGRTDNLSIHPHSDSYVLPADVVSGLGEGNSLAGAKALDLALSTGPHGIPMPSHGRGMGPPRPPRVTAGFRAGGGVRGFADGGDMGDTGFDPAMFNAFLSPGSALPPPHTGPFDPSMFNADQFLPNADAGTSDGPQLPVPPIPPSTHGMARHHPSLGQPHGSSPPPGNLPSPPPAPDASAAPSPSAGFGAGAAAQPSDANAPSSLDAVKRLGDLGSSIRSVPNNASPWLALLTAGAATLASPRRNALGEGLLQGVTQYANADKAAKDLAARVDESRAHLALSQAQGEQTGAYQTGELAARDKQLNQTGELTKAQMAQTFALKQQELGQERSLRMASLGQEASLANQRLGLERATLGETTRQHDLENQYKQDALNLGKYTYQQVTMPDPDDPTKTISGVNKLPTRGDEEPTFIRTNTNPNKTGADGISGRESVFFNRVAAAGNEAATAAANIAELPVNTSTGWFGGRQQSGGLLGAAKESLTNNLTSQNVQDYNTMIAGVARNLSTIEAAGLAPSGSLTHSMDSIILKEGDTPLTQMRKMAEMRQIVEKGLEPNLANPRIPQQQRDVVSGIIKQIQGSVPFTQHDVTTFERKGKTGQTLADYASGNNLGGRPSTVVTPSAATPSGTPSAGAGASAAPAWKYTAAGPGGAMIHSNDGSSWFTPDGKPFGAPP